jgi:transglutaminase-like putative cysteine protease
MLTMLQKIKKQVFLKNLITDMEEYLKPTKFVDCDQESIISFAKDVVGDETDKIEQAKKLYLAVRDRFPYDYYHIVLTEEAMKASSILKKGRGYCVEKSNLLGAAARSLGIPARFGFADVINHIGADKLRDILRTDVFAFHGYTELFLNGKWVKATPAFNKSLCEKLGVKPLEFNGLEDSVFQEYDDGVHFMEYIHFHGTFDDIPLDYFIATLRKHYPHLFSDTSQEGEMEKHFFKMQ